jgi:iron complex transport system ATP-binding protein
MRASTPLIDIRGLTIERGDTVILRGIDWQLRSREHWVILGANGSGKTSLLCGLAGYMVPTAGRISVLGRTYGQSDWRELRAEIGLVSSNLRQRIADDESAREVVASGKYAMLNFWGTLTRTDKSQASGLLNEIGCGGMEQRPWAVLSQGERQRVLIARALIARPRLLILDEPCAGLDPVARENFLHFLGRLGRLTNGPALVLVTHHVEEIIPLFTHVLLLKDGRAVAHGKKSHCLNGPLLSHTFNAPITLDKQGSRYSARIRTRPRRIV